MATKITFTDDVGVVATAQNTDASIRWHVYTRVVAGKTAIYVQRELSGVLQAEVKFIGDGSKPRITFDATLSPSKWILIYEFNEQSWLLLIDETTAPTLRPIQSETLLLHMRLGPGTPETPDVSTSQFSATGSVATVDAYSAPATQQAVGVGASPIAGKYSVRWIPRSLSANPDYNANIVGFNVWLRRADTGWTQKLNSDLVPFAGFTIHEFEVPAAGGTYMVTQVERKGNNSGETAESRLGAPRDEVRSDLPLLPTTIQSVMGRVIGEGDLGTANITADFNVIFIPAVIEDPPYPGGFPSHIGEGNLVRLTLTGFGSIVVG